MSLREMVAVSPPAPLVSMIVTLVGENMGVLWKEIWRDSSKARLVGA